MNGLLTRVRAVFVGRQTGRAGVLAIVALTLASKALGFLREMLIAYFFGATALVDAFVVANNIYGLTVGIIGHAFSVAGTPLLVEKFVKDGHPAQQSAFFAFLRFALTSALLLSLVLAIAAPGIVFLLAPRFPPETHWLSVKLLWAMLPMALGMVGLSLAGTYLNARRRFGLNKLGDISVNLVAIGFLFSAPLIGIYSLAVGWSLGYFLAACALLGPLVWRWAWWKGRLWTPEIKEFITLTAPMLVAYGASQVNTIVDRAFASSLDPGSIAALGYGWRLALIPAVLAQAVSTVQLTRASEMAAARDIKRLKSSVREILLKGAAVMIPVSVALVWLARPLIQMVFQRGAFDASATDKTSLALVCYGFGLFPQFAVLTLAASLRGMKDMKTPVIAGVIAVAVNIILNALLVRPFGIAGLAASTSAAAAVSAGVMGAMLWQR
jgi:putative peptidoglycan lipid II flippase